MAQSMLGACGHIFIPLALNIPFLLYAWNIPAMAVDYTGSMTLKVFLGNLGRLPLIIAYIAGALFSFNWGFLGAPFVAAGLLYVRNSMKLENLFLLWMIFFPLSGYVILLTITPADTFWQLSVAADRLLLHVAPLIIFFISRVYQEPQGPAPIATTA